MQKITVSHILKLSAPLMLANCIVPILGLLNTMIVGHLANASSLAAIALGASIFDFLFNICNFLRMSTTGLVAQAIHDPQKIRLVIMRGMLLALLIGALLIILQAPIGRLITVLIKTSPEVSQQMYAYFKINIWSAPAELCLFVITGWLVALKKTRQALYLVLLLISLAAPLGWWFVDGVTLSAKGIAFANVISTFMVMLLGMYWLQNEYHFLQHRITWRELLDWQELKPMLVLKGNVFLRTIALMLVYTSFTIHAATYGPLVLAANAILINMLMFSFYGLDSVANITESFVGIAISEQSELRFILRNTFISALILAILFSLMYTILGQSIIHLLTSISIVRTEAELYLPWTMVFPILSVTAFWIDGVFVGALKGKAMRNSMLISMLGYFVILSLTLSLKNNGLWLALLSFMVLRAIVQIGYIRNDNFFRRKISSVNP